MTKNEALEFWEEEFKAAKMRDGLDYDRQERKVHIYYKKVLTITIEALKAQKTGKWMNTKEGAQSVHYCSKCGFALMDSDESGKWVSLYMGIEFHRSNPERWLTCPGWNEWLMNYCPNCGAKMEGEESKE